MTDSPEDILARSGVKTLSKARLVKPGSPALRPDGDQPEARPSRHDINLDPPTVAYPFKWHGDPDDTQLREQLVDRMLPKVGTALLSGQWGLYKTFAALDLSGSVMTKTPFAEHAVLRQGGVLFIAAEGQKEIRPRLAGLASEKIAAREGTELILPEGVVAIDPERMPFVWIEACPRLTADDATAELNKIVGAAHREMQKRFGLPLVLVIIDALMPAANFKDADDAAEAQRVMSVLNAVALKADLLILVVDHFGKDASTGTRNSSVKEDAVEAVLVLLGDRGLAGLVENPRLGVRKQKGGRTGEEIPFKPREVTIYENSGFDAITTLVIDWAEPGPLEGAPRAQQRNPPRALNIFIKAFEFALTESGKRIHPFNTAVEVLAVDRESVRHEFMKIYPADNPDTKKKAFERKEVEAVVRHLMIAREVGTVEKPKMVFWKPAKGETS